VTAGAQVSAFFWFYTFIEFTLFKIIVNTTGIAKPVTPAILAFLYGRIGKIIEHIANFIYIQSRMTMSYEKIRRMGCTFSTHQNL